MSNGSEATAMIEVQFEAATTPAPHNSMRHRISATGEMELPGPGSMDLDGKMRSAIATGEAHAARPVAPSVTRHRHTNSRHSLHHHLGCV